MIVVRVELWSARTGRKTELARMHIINDDTGDLKRRNYHVETLRGRSAKAFARPVVQRSVRVTGWPSEALHVWNLVGFALAAMGYGKGTR
jgi:hypothetical protein